MFVHLKTFTIATCPYCLSANVRRSHRHFYEKPLSLLGIRPLRCLRCYARSWKFLSSNRLRFQKSREENSKIYALRKDVKKDEKDLRRNDRERDHHDNDSLLGD